MRANWHEYLDTVGWSSDSSNVYCGVLQTTVVLLASWRVPSCGSCLAFSIICSDRSPEALAEELFAAQQAVTAAAVREVGQLLFSVHCHQALPSSS